MDVYEALLDAKKHTEENGVVLNKEEERLLERMVLERTRNGLALSPEKKDALLEVRPAASFARCGVAKLIKMEVYRSRRKSCRWRWTSRPTATRKPASCSSRRR